MATAYEILRDSVSKVVKTFEESEAAGYRSRDRRYAIDVLQEALAAAERADDDEEYARMAEKERREAKESDEWWEGRSVDPKDG